MHSSVGSLVDKVSQLLLSYQGPQKKTSADGVVASITAITVEVYSVSMC